MRIKKTLLSGTAILAAFALTACASDQTKVEKQTTEQTTEQSATTQHTPPSEPQEQAAGNVGYQHQRQVVTTETENRSLPTVKQSTLKADINRMNATDFVALGIPINVAESIIKSRDEHGGRFTSVDDLKQVPGMSTAWVDRNKDRLGISTG